MRNHAMKNDDQVFQCARQRTLAKLKWHPLLNGVSRLAAMFGGPLLGAGLLALAGFGDNSRAVPAVLTAVGSALTVFSIVTEYIGTRIGQDGSLDQTEIAAQRTARHLLKAVRATRRSRRKSGAVQQLPNRTP